MAIITLLDMTQNLLARTDRLGYFLRVEFRLLPSCLIPTKPRSTASVLRPGILEVMHHALSQTTTWNPQYHDGPRSPVFPHLGLGSRN